MTANRIINGWYCSNCGQVTVVVHVDAGVTPMFLACRATPGCAGVGQSLGYPHDTPSNEVLATVAHEWAVPSRSQMKAWKRAGDPMYDHVARGGLVLRPLTDEGRRVLDTLRTPDPTEPAADPAEAAPSAASAGHQCPARMRPFPNSVELHCERAPHLPDDHTHEAVLRDYAYPGSRTTITWYDEDRRTFTGDWIECPHRGCTLPANHRGDHAA